MNTFRMTLFVTLATLGCACGSVKKMAIRSVADSLAQSGDTFSSDEDPQLVRDAREALDACGQRGLTNGGVFRLTGPGAMAVRAALQDYSEALPKISARCAIHCHRLAEKKVKAMK